MYEQVRTYFVADGINFKTIEPRGTSSGTDRRHIIIIAHSSCTRIILFFSMCFCSGSGNVYALAVDDVAPGSIVCELLDTRTKKFVADRARRESYFKLSSERVRCDVPCTIMVCYI